MTAATGRTPEHAYADTNLFVALFAGDTHPLHEQALGVFRRVAEGRLTLIVTSVVLGELVYVSKAVFGWNRSTIADRLGFALSVNGVVAQDLRVLHRTLELYAGHRRLDYADAYLAAIALEAGPPTVASLDADLDAVEGLRRIS